MIVRRLHGHGAEPRVRSLAGVFEHDLAITFSQRGQAFREIRLRHSPSKPGMRTIDRSGHAAGNHDIGAGASQPG